MSDESEADLGRVLARMPDRLDYHAAHAPEPPAWFAPVLKLDPPSARPECPGGLSNEALLVVAAAEENGAAETDGVKALPMVEYLVVGEYLAKLRFWEEARIDYCRQREMARLVQWRWYYAAQMVAGRP